MTRAITAALGLLLLSGCPYDMKDQARYEPYEPSTFFANGNADRTPVPGTVARGQLAREAIAEQPPAQPTRALLERGRTQYDIYCAPCHDRTGGGRGIIVQRGFQRPPTFHQERLRQAPDQHYYRVISEGFGAMYSYASRIEPNDRWAIVQYVRALQLSQDMPVQELSADARARLEAP